MTDEKAHAEIVDADFEAAAERATKGPGPSESAITELLRGPPQTPEGYGRVDAMLSRSDVVRMEELVMTDSPLSSSGVLRTFRRMSEHIEYLENSILNLSQGFSAQAMRLEDALINLAKQQDKDRERGDG